MTSSDVLKELSLTVEQQTQQLEKQTAKIKDQQEQIQKLLSEKQELSNEILKLNDSLQKLSEKNEKLNKALEVRKDAAQRYEIMKKEIDQAYKKGWISWSELQQLDIYMSLTKDYFKNSPI